MEDRWTNESSCLEACNTIPITRSVGTWLVWIQGKPQASLSIRAELMRVVPKCSVFIKRTKQIIHLIPIIFSLSVSDRLNTVYVLSYLSPCLNHKKKNNYHFLIT